MPSSEDPPSEIPDIIPFRKLIAEILDLARQIERLANTNPSLSETNVQLVRELIEDQVSVQSKRLVLSLLGLIEQEHDESFATRLQTYFDYWCEITSFAQEHDSPGISA